MSWLEYTVREAGQGGFWAEGERAGTGGFLRAAAGRAHCGGGSSFLGSGKRKDGVDSCIKARIQGALS
ncbi:hypothetical protein DXC92_24765 [Clostridiales bacterium TF09-2AC]|nr:hypothetical protein DXC92_24765 [Clostridiales bacterium TF09-2AC]